MKKILKFIIDILFPINCLACQKQGHWLCPECLDNINDFSYNNKILKQAVHLYKYNFIKDLSKPLAQILKQRIDFDYDYDYDYIVPVPLHPRRKRWRGFNQSELLALEINKDKTLNALERIKNTRPQMQLKQYKRIHNVRDAFVCVQDIKGKKILLLDDVKTTGSTLKECKLTLLKAGASQVFALTLLET